MKVELHVDGCLQIKAESAIESFALGHWLTLWNEHKAFLQIETPNDAPMVRTQSPETANKDKP